jgi:hypothetical protein
MPENISGVPAGRSVFHLTSPLIGLLARNNFRLGQLLAKSARNGCVSDLPLYTRLSMLLN